MKAITKMPRRKKTVLRVARVQRALFKRSIYDDLVAEAEELVGRGGPFLERAYGHKHQAPQLVTQRLDFRATGNHR